MTGLLSVKGRMRLFFRSGLLVVLLGCLFAYDGLNNYQAKVGRSEAIHGRSLGVFNFTEPEEIKFCDPRYPDIADNINATAISVKLVNLFRVANNNSACKIDSTDYGSYLNPPVNPCNTLGSLPYIVGLFYMFMGLAIVCDEFFVPALEVMVERFQLSDDVAGATLMAAGGSAPELFTSIMGTFFADSNVGFGTVVGSAVFNVLFVIGMCALFSKDVLELTWWPLARDSSYYTISLSVLACFYGVVSPNVIELWEAIILFGMYFGYVGLMSQNEKLFNFFSAAETRVAPADGDGDEGGHKLVSACSSISKEINPFIRHDKFRAGLLSMMYKSDADVMDNARIHVVSEIVGGVKQTFKTLDVDKSGFIEREELKTLLQKLTNVEPTADEVEKALSQINTAGDGRISFDEFKKWYIKSEERVLSDMHKYFDVMDTSHDGYLEYEEIVEVVKQIAGDNDISQEDIDEAMSAFEKDKDAKICFDEFAEWYKKSLLWKQVVQKVQEDEEGGPLELDWPDDLTGKLIRIGTAPIVLPLYFTVPDVRRPDGEKYWPFTWSLSIMWIAIYSYFMVWWAMLLGDTVGVPPAVMGLTFLAAGTSIPDLITSVIVARQGLGDMAVSSSIGSNIFDILVGLPFPWILYNLTHEDSVEVTGDDLFTSVLTLILMLVCVVVTIAANGWKMTKTLGLTMFALYVVFVVTDLLRQGSGC